LFGVSASDEVVYISCLRNVRYRWQAMTRLSLFYTELSALYDDVKCLE